MSMWAWSPESVARVLDAVEPRLAPGVRSAFLSMTSGPELPAGARVCLVGHRAAGKTTLLRALQSAVRGMPAVDLDEIIARDHGEIRALFSRGEPVFRAAEREAFNALPAPALVACGGGFLSNHADLLGGHVAVIVPVTFETFCERLVADTARPRLHPQLSIHDELRLVFDGREAKHAHVNTWTIPQLLWATGARPGMEGA